MLAYLFSSSSLSPKTIEIGEDLLKSEEMLQPSVKINRELMFTNVNDTSCAKVPNYGIPSESSNLRTNINIQTKTIEYSESNENFKDGKQIRNDCDIGNSSSGENLDLCNKGGNKKMQ